MATVHMLSEYLRQGKPEKEQQQELSQKERLLQSIYHRQIEEVLTLKNAVNGWIIPGWKNSRELLIIGAKEQVLSTRLIEAGVDHTRQDPRCTVCTWGLTCLHLAGYKV